MEILIPSKNIYEINNNKIRNNVINEVNVEQTVIAQNNNFESPIYNTKIEKDIVNYPTQSKNNIYGKSDNYTLIRGYWIGYVNVESGYFEIPEIAIPKVSNNTYISKMLYGKNDDGEPNIKTSLYLTRKVYNSSASASFFPNGYSTDSNDPSLENHKLQSVGKITKGSLVEETQGYDNIEVPTVFEFPYNPRIGPFTNFDTNKVVIKNAFTSQENIANESIFSEGKDYYFLRNVKILAKANITTLFDWQYKSYSEDDWATELREVTLEGTTEEYLASQVDITVYGNTISIDLTNGYANYKGEGKGRAHLLNGNELLQSGNVSFNRPTTAYLAQDILSQYKNGKETISLLCDISDYYEYDETATNLKGEKVISISSEKMCFALHDKIVPMVMGANGQDRFISYYQDNTPKVFRVIGSEIIYDGSIMQKIFATEI